MLLTDHRYVSVKNTGIYHGIAPYFKSKISVIFTYKRLR